MKSVVFLVDPLSTTKFSGGILCVLMHAINLQEYGVRVSIVPLEPSPYPNWIDEASNKLNLRSSRKKQLVWEASKLAFTLPSLFINRVQQKQRVKSNVSAMLESILLIEPRLLTYSFKRPIQLAHVRRNICEADVTIATSYSTVLPAYLYGSNKKYWFAMHYEPLFAPDLESPKEAAFDSKSVFDLGIPVIVNSIWLKDTIERETAAKVVGVCPNAIDHSVFYGQVNDRPFDSQVRVISYGGRGATWKGFAELAKAVALVRTSLPDINLRWLVYGDALLPPNNGIADYEQLGHLRQVELGDYYRKSDIFLSASWYESFPLFPLEAMACGLPVIATSYGAEDFVIPHLTAAVVERQNVESIADALNKLICDRTYRVEIAKNGLEISKKFTWRNASERLREIIS